MKQTKFVKARCEKTGAAFGIEVKQFGKNWKAVDFVRLTDAQDAKIESQITVDRLETADNLQSCAVCGNRVVGKCECPTHQKRNCRKDESYRYQCIFCNNLKLDYSSASEAREGEQITLSQGQVITLTKRGSNISKLLIGMGWKPSKTSDNMDLDASVVMLRRTGEVHEIVYFGHLQDAAGSIYHHGDNLTGSLKINGEQDDENIFIELAKIPSEVQCLVFIVNIFACKDRHQRLKDVDDMHIRLIEENTKQVLAQYHTFAQDRTSTGLIIGAAYRAYGKWNFKAMGDCYEVASYRELAEITRDKCKSLLRN